MFQNKWIDFQEYQQICCGDKRAAKLISSTEAIKDNLMFLKILFSPYAGHKIPYSGGDALTEYG